MGPGHHREQQDDRGAAGKDGKKYYFPDDMADKTIEWLHDVRAQDPAKPWFVYFSTGCAHAPHHVPQEWAARYKGKFDAAGMPTGRRRSSGRSGWA